MQGLADSDKEKVARLDLVTLDHDSARRFGEMDVAMKSNPMIYNIYFKTQ